MADDNNNDSNRKAEEQRKAADQQRQQQQREQNARTSKAQGSADNRAGADAGGYEEMERRAAEIEAHEDEKQKMFDEATDAAIDEAAPAIGEGGGHFLGGMEIVDTRAVARTPANIQVQDPNIAAKRRIGEENRSYGRQTDRDVVRARERNPNDPTAMAEAAARR